MCFKLQIYHYSCSMSGGSVLFPCESPDTCGMLQIRKQKVEEYPLPDFCHSCFLQGGLFIDTLSPLKRAEILESKIYKDFTNDAALKLADDMWDRAESDPSNTGDLEYFVNQLQPNGSSDITQTAILLVLRYLRGSFWHQVLEKKQSPSKFRRAVINQLLNYQITHYLHHARRIYALSETAKLYRPAILKGMVEHPSITTLPVEDHNCNICTERLSVPNEEGVIESVVKTNCKHLFGDQCLYCWILDNETCPNCRRPLLTFADGEKRYLQEAKAARQANGLPQWLVFISALDHDTLESTSRLRSMADPLRFSLFGILSDEDDPDVFAYMNFGFMQ